MSYLPLFHVFGFGEISLMCLLTGARQVLLDVFDPDERSTPPSVKAAPSSTASTLIGPA